jgi:hypothetical protein
LKIKRRNPTVNIIYKKALKFKKYIYKKLPQEDDFRNFLDEFKMFCLTVEADKLYKELMI